MRIIFIAGCLHVASSMFAECTDAGVCRLSSRPESDQEHGLNLGVRVGTASFKDISYRTAMLGVGWTNSSGSTALGAEVAAVSIDGPAGRSDGIGDSLVHIRQDVLEAGGIWSILLGSRLPTGDDNIKPGLPQAYQTGLGPADMQVGIAWRQSSLQAFVAYSHSGGANGLEGTELERGDDLAAAVSWQSPDGHLQPGLQIIAIQRIAESSVVGPGGNRVSVNGSDGLQVNLRPFVSWRHSDRVSFVASAAFPLLARSNNVDGLSRGYGIDLGISVQF